MPRNSSSSSRQSTQLATCAVTAARALGSRRSCSSSGNWSRISALIQSFIEKLLHSAHCVVVMHPRGSFRRAYRLGDLLVRQSFRNSQREYFFLRRRQFSDRVLQPLLRFIRDYRVQRVILGRRVILLHLVPISSSLLGPLSVDEQSTKNREQPCSKRAVAPKALERVERSDEGILHELVDLVPFARADREPGERLGVSLDECRGRPI